ncbi:MAG: hypothetical protein K0A94_02650 [Desulfuromonadales bacterium]|nr:hypothetical protein [Desulfuromonadales bacterium]
MLMPFPLRRFLFVGCMLLVLLGVQAPAVKADVIDDLANLLEAVEEFSGPISWLPVSGKDIRDSRDLINCIENAGNDVAVLTCMENYRNTPVGQSIGQESGIPSWFWDLMDTYIAFRVGDYWELVLRLGKAAVCIIAQFVSGGVDICALVEALIEIGKQMLDAATAVAEFFMDLGSAVWGAVKDVGCALGLGGCSDDKTPAEVIIYYWVFAPKVSPEGLQAIKAVDGTAFTAFKSQLEANALSKPPKVSDPLVQNFVNDSGISFSKVEVDMAAKIYDKAVVAQWSADIVENVLIDLVQARNSYGTPAQIAALAGPAIADNAPSGANIKNQAGYLCTADFNQNMGFAHVDRWVYRFSAEAQTLSLVSNFGWCQTSFWSPQVRSEFAKHLRKYVGDHYCSLSGSQLRCASLEKYEACASMMGVVDYEGDCAVDRTKVGKEVAEKIAAELKARGSTHTYAIRAPLLQIAAKPVDLVCVRPTQVHACNNIYQSMFAHLPEQVVNCKLEMSPAYVALTQATAAEADRLAKKYQQPIVVDGLDPLIVVAPSTQLIDSVQNDPQQQFVFQFNPLKIPRSIDGVNQPTMAYDMELPTPQGSFSRDQLKDEILGFREGGGVDPYEKNIRDRITSPVDRVTLPTERLTTDQFQQVRPQALEQTRLSEQMTTGAPGQLRSTLPGQATLTPEGMAGEAMRPMSGGVAPTGVQGGGAPLASGQLQLPPQQVQPLQATALPDLTADVQVLIGGSRTAWGQQVTLAADQAQKKEQGTCFFPVQYGVNNMSTVAAGPFYSAWDNVLVPTPVGRNWTGLAAGAKATHTDLLPLKPGNNAITLTLDQRRQVQESDENNNLFRLNVLLNGSCEVLQRQPSAPAPPRLPTPGR